MKKYKRWMFKIKKEGPMYNIYFKGQPLVYGYIYKKSARDKIKQYIKEANKKIKEETK